MAWAEDLIRFALQVFDSPEQTIDALEAAVSAMKPLDTWTNVLPRRLGEQYRKRHPDDPGDKVGKALEAYVKSLKASLDNARARPVPRDPIGGLQRFFEMGEADKTFHALEMFYMSSLVQIPDDVGMIYRYGDPHHRTRNTVGIWEVALEVFPRKTFPREWERIQRNLAAAQGRVPEAPADDIEHTIAVHEMTLSRLTREGFPADRAKAEYDLAGLYLDRIGGDRADNLDRATALLESAQTVFTREAYPADWARIQDRLASACSEQTRGPRAEILERGIAFCEAALTVFTREDFPVDWARVQNNLGVDYQQRIYGDPADNMEHAITCVGAALTIRTREKSPAAWADTTHNLASAYQRRLVGSRADNIETAILHYRAALKVRTREAFPAQWLNTQTNLALAYFQRPRGDEADNIEQAIRLYEAALAADIREAFPGDRAATRRNLANIYAKRMRGVRYDNLRRAVVLLEEALTVNTREAMPLDHLGASHDLGRTLMTTENWARASAVLAHACDAFLVLYGLGLGETESGGLIEAAGSLFADAAYAAAELGDTERAFNLACEGKARLLTTALHLQTIDLDAPRRQRLEELRTAIREQSRLLDRAAGTGRGDVLAQLRELHRELSGLVAESAARTGEADALALARPLVADGGAIVVAIVTAIGGKLLLVTAGPDRPVLTVIDLPELTTARIARLLGDEAADSRHNWLTTLIDRGTWPVERKQAAVRLIDAAGLDLGGPPCRAARVGAQAARHRAGVSSHVPAPCRARPPPDRAGAAASAGRLPWAPHDRRTAPAARAGAEAVAGAAPHRGLRYRPCTQPDCARQSQPAGGTARRAFTRSCRQSHRRPCFRGRRRSPRGGALRLRQPPCAGPAHGAAGDGADRAQREKLLALRDPRPIRPVSAAALGAGSERWRAPQRCQPARFAGSRPTAAGDAVSLRDRPASDSPYAGRVRRPAGRLHGRRGGGGGRHLVAGR
jgi:tetratricopeptide (TPR) repeat protein